MILKKSVTTTERNEKGYAQHYDITADVKVNPLSVRILEIIEVNTLNGEVTSKSSIPLGFALSIIITHYENQVDWESVYNEHLFDLTHGDK